MGKPIEKVVFVRDEIANLVFGVEKIVPTGFGLGKEGIEKKKATSWKIYRLEALKSRQLSKKIGFHLS